MANKSTTGPNFENLFAVEGTTMTPELKAKLKKVFNIAVIQKVREYHIPSSMKSAGSICEDKAPAYMDHTKNPFHKVLQKHGMVHVKTKSFKNNSSNAQPEDHDTTAHTYEHPTKMGTWTADVVCPHPNSTKRLHCYYKNSDGDVDVAFMASDKKMNAYLASHTNTTS